MNELTTVKKTVTRVMAELGVEKNAPGMLVVTNAEYACLEGAPAVLLLDILSEVTGCTRGKGSLLGALTSCDTLVWFSIRNGAGKTAFLQWNVGGIQIQFFDASPDNLFEYDQWHKIAEGIIGPDKLYTIGSIGSLWLQKVPWPVLKGAEMHGAGCPGNNAGFLVHTYLQKSLPLAGGDYYLFLFSPPTCGMDILRIIYASSAGEKQMLAMKVAPDKLNSYFDPNVVTFATVIRVNPTQNSCKGVVLGFDLRAACRDAGVDVATFFPKGNRANPRFGFSRAKVSTAMAMLSVDEQMRYISELKLFSGAAQVAQEIATIGCDPYEKIFLL